VTQVRTRAGDERRTQEERSATTRAKVLDATVASVIEHGYAATTSAVIAERAGVSRGAQQYHFPSKEGLVTAVVEHLARRVGLELRDAATRLPTNSSRVDAAIDLLWQHFSAPLFPALLELMVAARTDHELAAVVGEMSSRLTVALNRQTRDVFGPDISRNRSFNLMLEMTLDLLSGLALQRATGIGDPRLRIRTERRVLAAWKEMAARMLMESAPQP
jgi:AcrR family transcriptional regulator